MRTRFRWILMSAVGAAGAAAIAANLGAAGRSGARTVELFETVRIAVPEHAGDIRLWIPKPPSLGSQSTELLGVESQSPYRITSDPEFGNQTLFVGVRKPRSRVLRLTLRYRITRREQEISESAEGPTSIDLKPRGLLAVNDEIRQIAGEQTKGMTDSIEKGRALYQYVLRRMAYDKSGQDWGRGDSIYACQVGKGNCTDFHSLFMALAMASGIPARFRMGLSLPEASEGTVSGYHCWAEFYAKGSWIPVDISEAWKNPKRADYYFGHLDVNRVLVSTGREIRLSPAQKGPPLNFFHRPYAEADGKPLYDIEFVRSYKNVRSRA